MAPSGGGGSIQNMLVTLRNNRNLLRKRKTIYKERGKPFEADGLGATARGKLDTTPATVEQLAAVRQKMHRQRLRSRWGIFTVSALLVGSIGAVIWLGSSFFEPAPGWVLTDVRSCEDQVPMETYQFSIQDAEQWLRKDHYKNAVFMADKAKQVCVECVEARHKQHIRAGDSLLANGHENKACWEYRCAEMLYPNEVVSVQRLVRCYQRSSVERPEYLLKVENWKYKLASLDPSGDAIGRCDRELEARLKQFKPDS